MVSKDKDYETMAINLFKKVLPKYKDKIKSIRPIHNGYTNASYLITLENEIKYQVRIPGEGGQYIDRKAEKKVLDLVNSDLFVYFDVKTGKAIKKWVEGTLPLKLIYKNPEFQDKLYSQIKKIHAIPVKKQYKIPAIDFEFFNQNLPKLKFEYQRKYLCLLDRRRSEPFVINHSDINPMNIIYSKDKITLIDYEWACLAPDYWDYANWIRETGLDVTKTDWKKYIKDFDLEKLYDYVFLSSVFAYLWTYAMPQTRQINRYRKQTYKQIKKAYAHVIRHEKICYK